jgi:formate hydrogenlyase transcriptional activator
MADHERDGQALSADPQYRALLAVSEAIAAHRDLSALFHELAGRLRQLVRFDHLGVFLHQAEGNTLRLHVLEPSGPTMPSAFMSAPVGETPAGLVWQTQQPLILSNLAEDQRWPRLQERARPYGAQSFCWLPLATARRQLGTLNFTCKLAVRL